MSALMLKISGLQMQNREWTLGLGEANENRSGLRGSESAEAAKVVRDEGGRRIVKRVYGSISILASISNVYMSFSFPPPLILLSSPSSS